MNLQEYRSKLQNDNEYKKLEEKLKPLFDLADEVLRLRLEKGWSQTELAERVGTKQSNISQLERAEGNPTFDFINRVANALDTTLDIRLARKSVSYDTMDDSPTLVKDWPMPSGRQQVTSQSDTILALF